MADHFNLWAIASRDRVPADDFTDATYEDQVLEAGAELRFSRRYFKMMPGEELPLGARFVSVQGDIYHQVELTPGIAGFSRLNALSPAPPKFPPIQGYRFQGDIPGLTQVVRHNNWLAIAAEAIGDAALPPAWADRTPGDDMTVGQAGALRNFVIGTCEEEHQDLVTAWFSHLVDKYTTGDPAALHFTPLNFRLELVRYTS